MPPSAHITVRIDLARIQRNAQQIRSDAGVPILAVVKADAYGLGAERIIAAIADIVAGYCVFSLAEAATAGIRRTTGKPSLALGPNTGVCADEFLAHGVRPAVWDVHRAKALSAARPILAVDTGMQRFSSTADQIGAVLAAGQCAEAFTHATSMAQVERFLELVGNRGLTLHAAGSSLLAEPRAWLDAVRPGLALYRGAARVSSRLLEERQSNGPAGYSGFHCARHGVILGGYSNGLRPGPCMINGRPSRLLEVGMQTSFVETAENDLVGDEVVLLGDGLTEADIARVWNTSPQEVLTRLCNAGLREYVG